MVSAENSEYPLEIYQFLKRIDSCSRPFILPAERKAAPPDKHSLILIYPHEQPPGNAFCYRTQVQDCLSCKSSGVLLGSPPISRASFGTI